MGNTLSSGENTARYVTDSQLTGYVKQEDLLNYASKSDLQNITPEVNLQGYAKIEDLSMFAKTSDLGGYAKAGDLSSFAKTSDLGNYVLTSSLDDYKKQAGDFVTQISNQLTGFVKTDTLNAYARQTDLAAYIKGNALDNYVKSANLPGVTMFCADGNVCTIPKGKMVNIENGSNAGITHFNYQNKGENYLRGKTVIDDLNTTKINGQDFATFKSSLKGEQGIPGATGNLTNNSGFLLSGGPSETGLKLMTKESSRNNVYMNAIVQAKNDGPLLHGFNGGSLGWRPGQADQGVALHWDDQGDVTVAGRLCFSSPNGNRCLALNESQNLIWVNKDNRTQAPYSKIA